MPTENAPAAGADTAHGYDRRRDLPRLLPLWPHEMELTSVAEHARLLARMRRALRLERQRGRAGHWAYDLARHAQLLRAYRAEVADYLRRVPAQRGNACWKV
ncbi:MAG: DUF6477 family protein [Hyphomicrobium sp.]|nr:MAG: hypothetical protein F9K20_12980 [Hyphomicrobium sp.]MBZ0210339.1 DUF6477 family protein [Hyphomicrobium sp.]MCZ7595236.1 DUF6477 family protein [Hyphomicrobium sp.]